MSPRSSVIVTGSRGQDGSYLVDMLRARGAEVTEVSRAGALLPNGSSVPCDLSDARAASELISQTQPEACFHLAACSVATSRDEAALAFNHRSTVNLCDAIAAHAPQCRFLLAGSSEMFGDPPHTPQDEHTPFAPTTPYGRSKLAAHEAVRAARARGLFAVTAILFNHESPRRPAHFVTRKVSVAVAEIHLGRRHKLVLGSLDGRRDWGYAPEYVDAMARMVEMDAPEDLVLATGETHSVRELVDAAFAAVGRRAADHVESDPSLFRKESALELRGDASRAADMLDWRAQRRMAEVVEEMVRADLARLSTEG